MANDFVINKKFPALSPIIKRTLLSALVVLIFLFGTLIMVQSTFLPASLFTLGAVALVTFPLISALSTFNPVIEKYKRVAYGLIAALLGILFVIGLSGMTPINNPSVAEIFVLAMGIMIVCFEVVVSSKEAARMKATDQQMAELKELSKMIT
jgi:hypothetical protein